MAEIRITVQNFEQEIIFGKTPMLLDFYATWCGPCKMLAPHLKEIAVEYEGRVNVGKVDVDEERGLAMQFGITGVPTLLLFKEGKVVAKAVGYRDKAQIEEMLQKAL